MARPNERHIFAQKITMLNYLDSQGFFDGPEERCIPLARLADRLGLGQEETRRLAESLACSGPDSHYAIPIFFERLKGELVLCCSPYDLPSLPVRLTSLECAALHKALGQMEDDADKGLLEKLKGAMSPSFPKGGAENIVFDVDRPTDAKAAHRLAVLRDAIDRRLITHIAYRKPGQLDAQARDIEPLGLYLENGRWMLTAYCRLRGAVRTFSVDRIEHAKASSRSFKPKEHPELRFLKDIAAGGDLDGKAVRARLLILPQARLERGQWPGITLEEPDESGETKAEMPYAGGSWLPEKIVEQLGWVRVLAPASLADDVARRARERRNRADKAMRGFAALNLPELIGDDLLSGQREEIPDLTREVLLETLGHSAG